VKDLERIFSDLAEGFAAGGSLLLLSDYDGTLTPIVSDPEQARLDPVARDDLAALARASRVRVGILSGRVLDDLRARVGVPEIIYAGCHGLEAQGPGIAFSHPQAEARRGTMEALARSLSHRLAAVEGARVEPKGLTVAVHYRNVPKGSVGRVQSHIEQVMCEHGGTFKVLKGKKVTEVLPHVNWNKGKCALWIRDRVLSALPWPITMLYMGDDKTDELAFKALSEKVITVRVGPGRGRSAAACRLANVTDVHRLLSALAAEGSDKTGYHKSRRTTRSVKPGAP
jgi:trehalose-phosphatase